LAPTISSSLRIRAPNGCNSTPLEDVFKKQSINNVEIKKEK